MSEDRKEMEIFKDIKGYPSYQISNMGRIWSAKSHKYLSPFINNSGYLQINIIAANGKRKGELIHRLVALAFVDNPEGKPEVDHIDKDKMNCRADNLRWATRSENNLNKNHYTHSKEWFEKRNSKKIKI